LRDARIDHGHVGDRQIVRVRLLSEHGHRAIDLDTDEWAPLSDDEAPGTSADTVWQFQDWVWREDRFECLLASNHARFMFASGTASNQGRFHRFFDRIIVLSAPPHLLTERLSSRNGNDYGKRHPIGLTSSINQHQSRFTAGSP
jgi:hypothetical protein